MAGKKAIDNAKKTMIANNNAEKKATEVSKEKAVVKEAVKETEAAEDKKAAPVKAEVKEEVKPAANKAEEKKAEVTKVEEKKAEDKKTAEKKPTAKKPTAKKEVTETVFVQFAGKEVAVSDMMPKIKKVWQKAGNRIKDIQDVKLYVKPEDGKVYFVINDDFSDSVDFE